MVDNGRGVSFGRISGVEIKFYVLPSLPYIFWQPQKLTGWWRFGIWWFRSRVESSFLEAITGKRVVFAWEDGILWKESKDGKFLVKPLLSYGDGDKITFFSCVLIRVGFFTWEVLWGRL